MPYIVKHRRPPEAWHEFRRRALHRYLVPLYYANWLGEWVAYGLGRWSVFEVLEYVGSLSVLVAVIFYFAGSSDRLKQKHYQAWQVINTAQGKGGSGGRIEALQELNEDRVPLVGVEVRDAYLRGVKLDHADLRRGDFAGTDLRGGVLVYAKLVDANLRSANLREGDLRGADLTDANLFDADLSGTTLAGAMLHHANLERADLRGADLANVRDWREVSAIRLANVRGVLHAPPGFVEWAKAGGAVEESDDDAWAKRIHAAEKQQATTTTTAREGP